jgi:hypothetical protein
MKTEKLFEKLRVPENAETKEVEIAKKDISKVYATAEAIEVNDNETLLQAESFSTACAKHVKLVKEKFKSLIDADKKQYDAAREAHNVMLAFIKGITAPVDDAKKLVDAKARNYRIEEQKKIDAENERKRIEAQKEASKKRMEEIKALRASGEKEAAKRLKDEPIEAAPIIEEKLPESNLVHQQNWTAELMTSEADALLQIVKAASKDMTLLSYLKLDRVAINKEAKAKKQNFNVPGFRAVNVGKTLHR